MALPIVAGISLAMAVFVFLARSTMRSSTDHPLAAASATATAKAASNTKDGIGMVTGNQIKADNVDEGDEESGVGVVSMKSSWDLFSMLLSLPLSFMTGVFNVLLIPEYLHNGQIININNLIFVN